MMRMTVTMTVIMRVIVVRRLEAELGGSTAEHRLQMAADQGDGDKQADRVELPPEVRQSQAFAGRRIDLRPDVRDHHGKQKRGRPGAAAEKRPQSFPVDRQKPDGNPENPGPQARCEKK